MENDPKYLVHECLHCGNTGMQEIVVAKRVNSNDIQVVEGSDYYQEILETTITYLLNCPVCNQFTLIQNYTNDSYSSIPERHFDEVELYPGKAFSTVGVPEGIASSFETAMKIKKINLDICALSLRKTLEEICVDKGATGRTLEIKLSNLAKQNIIPVGLNEACKIIRILGNKAAHTADVAVLSHEIDLLVEFLKVIIYHLYTLPIELERMKPRLLEIEKNYGIKR